MDKKVFNMNDVDEFLKLVNLDITTVKFTKEAILKGLKVELEHGTVNSFTNVTNDDLVLTGKIALAHLYELPDYYERLEKMEKNGDKDREDKKEVIGGGKNKTRIYKLKF